MQGASVQKIARVLKVLVSITFVCNLIALYLVPTVVMSNSHSLMEGIQSYLGGIFFPGEDDIVMAGVFASFLSWLWVWADPYDLVLTVFLLFSGCCTAVVLRQGRRVLDTILRGEPFAAENAVSLKRAAVCAFLIAAAALARVVWSICFYRSFHPLTSYNALFVPIFAMAGLLCLIMSALFRQAAEIKAENDLTI